MLHQTLHGVWAFYGWLYSRLIKPCDITGINDGGLKQSAMEEPTQQPSDNSIRQADSIETEAELDAAILAAIERANEAHSVESSDDNSDDYVDAGFDIVLVDPSLLIESPCDENHEHEVLSAPVPISPSVENEMLSQFSADDSHSMLMGMMISPSYQEYEAEDLSPQIPMALPVEEVKLPQPQSDDAVLGGQNPTLACSGVLGGIEGVKRRLASTAIEQKIAALKEALKYGQAGVDLVIQALKEESKSVAQAVYWQFRDSSEPLAQQALQEYNPYQFLECIFSGDLARNGTNPIAISPDSQTLVCGSVREGFILWNLYTGKRQPTLRTHSASISCIAVSPDGLTLITGDWNGIIALWNLPTGEQKSILQGSSGMINSVAISPDGHTFVSGSDDGTIKVWNLSTCEELHTVKGYSIEVNFVAISPDNFTLVSHGTDRMGGGITRSIKLWNLHTGKERTTLKKHSSHCVAISSDSLTLISGSRDRSIKLWNLHTGEERNTIKAYTRPSEFVSALAISPDGQTLFSGSHFGTIKLWNIATGKQLHTIEGHSSHVSSIAISPDGQTIVSTSDDGTIKVWR